MTLHNVFIKVGLVLISSHDLMKAKCAECQKHTRTFRTFCLGKGQGLCFGSVMDNEGVNLIRWIRLNDITDSWPPPNMDVYETNSKNTSLAHQTFLSIFGFRYPLRVV